MVINGYKLISELKSDNSGFAKWGFAQKDGIELFIKQFLTPVYPVDNNVLSQEQIERKKRICDQFEQRKRSFYGILNQCNTGNIITVCDFFRYESRYYVVTEKVESISLSVEQISQLPLEKKLLILKTILYNISTLHKKGIVHADIKPNNILIKKTSKGFYTAKIIDFDSGFLEKDSLTEISSECDLVYLSPEVYLYMADEKKNAAELTHKIDIFALGILFYQYLTGEMPGFDRSKYDYAVEAVLDDADISIDPDLDSNTKNIIRKMLSKDPDERPEAWQIFKSLSEEKSIDEKISSVRSSSKLKITMKKSDALKETSPFLKQAGDL